MTAGNSKTSIVNLIQSAAKASVSRRALLSGILGTVGLLSVRHPVLAETTTSSAEALEGEAVEDKPDYTLVAQFAKYELGLEYTVNKDGKLDPYGTEIKSESFEYPCRSWAKDGVLDDNFLGPVLEMEPGQTLKIKIINKMIEEGEFANIGPVEPKPEDWFYLIDQQNGPSIALNKLDPFGYPFANKCTPATKIEDIFVDEVNVPKNYNWTNLHTHGLQVTPHLFEPEGTLDEKSDYITIKPGEERTYSFSLAEDHPCGTYWYHPHRHNSVAIQAWSGMAGLILVRGKYDEELKSVGVTTEIPFAVHDPHYDLNELPKDGQLGKAAVARFLKNQNAQSDTTFLVTGRYQPNYKIKRNEVVLFRHLTATIENLSGFRVIRKTPDGKAPSTDKDNFPFYVIASDGIAYDKPVKRNLMVTSGGERHDLLLQLPEAGEYEIWSDHCSTVQFYGTGPRDYLLATLTVIDEEASGQAPIEQMTFTPGIPPEQDITFDEIVKRRHFVFDLEGDTCRFPWPQFKINDRDYRPDESYFDVKAGTAEEWVVSNPTAATHPIHVHVNPYQVKEAWGALTLREDLVKEEDRAAVQARIEAMRHLDRENMWRDTIIVPPKGMVRLWLRFDEKLVGKTVFHCHFLAHEETGMLQNFRIVP